MFSMCYKVIRAKFFLNKTGLTDPFTTLYKVTLKDRRCSSEDFV